MDPVRFAVLLAGAFFLAFGLAAYRYFYTVLGAAAGLVLWVALADTFIKLPGLREHPGTSSILILVLFLLAGIFFATRYRRFLSFLSGLGTGIVLSRTVSVFMAGGTLSGAGIRLADPGAMDLLAGLIGGVLFLLFEGVFAVLLTSVIGSFLCTWALGDWRAFPACLLAGIIAQLLIFRKLKPSPPPGNQTGRSKTAIMIFWLIMVLPVPSAAGWLVDRVQVPTSRVVIDAGWRDGVKKGENCAVVDEGGSLVVTISIGEVFAGSSYSVTLPADRLKLIEKGMRVVGMEAYEFSQAMELGGEPRLREFLEKYPDSANRRKIMDALDETRYRKAELSGTIDAFREFQRMYPTSRYGSRARAREEELVFLKALETGTEEAFRDFINRFGGTSLVSGMSEVRAFFRAREISRVYAYQDFLAAYPRGRLAGEFIPYIDEFEIWAETLEFGSDPVEALRYFGQLGDETAVPYLVGKLNVAKLEEEARNSIIMIGRPALSTLMEVLISPLQSIELKDKVALIIGEMGDISAFPALRSYFEKEKTAAGRKALLMLEESVGR